MELTYRNFRLLGILDGTGPDTVGPLRRAGAESQGDVSSRELLVDSLELGSDNSSIVIDLCGPAETFDEVAIWIGGRTSSEPLSEDDTDSGPELVAELMETVLEREIEVDKSWTEKFGLRTTHMDGQPTMRLELIPIDRSDLPRDLMEFFVPELGTKG